MKKKIIKIVIIILLFISGILLTYFVTKKVTKDKYEQPEIKSIEVFGQKIKIEPKKKVYRIFMDSAKIEWNGNGCGPEPIEIKFKEPYEVNGGFAFAVAGEDHIYYGASAVKKGGKTNNGEIKQTNKKIDSTYGFDVYVEIVLDKPLEIDKECIINE